jgi:hypothetical protein
MAGLVQIQQQFFGEFMQKFEHCASLHATSSCKG